MLRDFICWLIGHTTLPNVEKAYAIVYHCPRCRSLVPGGLALEDARR